MSRRRLISAGLAFTAAITAFVAWSASNDGPLPRQDAAVAAPAASPYSDQTIVVRGHTAEDLDALTWLAVSRGYGVAARDDDLRVLGLQVPEGTTVLHAVRDFMGAPGVVYVEPAYVMTTFDNPSDPLFSRQLTYLARVRAPEAWNIETGKPSVTVAVLDTGIDVNHPDLQGRIWLNSGETANNNRDDDGNGCVDDINGCSFLDSPSSGCQRATSGYINDEVGHGTFVAGIIAANGNNAGMVGVARGATIMPVKVLDCAGSGTSLSLAQGILYAAKSGADVLNISLGGSIDAVVVREAVRIAKEEYGVVLVAATGNSGSEGVAYPARYPQTIAVGAASISNPDQRARFSTTGQEVDVVAIGENIVGTVPQSSCLKFLPCISGGPYAQGDGTSFSAPQVSGLVALMLSRNPNHTPDTVRTVLRQTAEVVPAGDRANWAGAGRINMLEALRPQYRIGAPGTTRN